MGFAKMLGGSVADKGHARVEKFRHQGGVRDGEQDVFASGVQVVQPLTQTGKRLAAGSYYTWGDQEVRTMDGSYRLIDTGIMNEEINTVLSNEKAVLDLVELFLKSGNDTIAKKYLGGFYDLLSSSSNATILERCLSAQNVPDSAEISAGMAKVEARPSKLRYMSELSDKFGEGVQKLKHVITFAGLVFDSKSLKRDPEGIRGNVKEVTAGDVEDSKGVKINDLVNA